MGKKKTTGIQFWNSVSAVDRDHTEQFTRGDFHGTAIKPYWFIRHVTEQWGPIGLDWGYKEEENKVVQGVWNSKVLVYYRKSLIREGDEGFGTIPGWGAARISDHFADEVSKMALMDGVMKALSLLGFCGDVYMGRFDDSKYYSAKQKLNEYKQEEKPAAPVQPEQKPTTPPRQQTTSQQFTPGPSLGQSGGQSRRVAGDNGMVPQVGIKTNEPLPEFDGVDIWQAADGNGNLFTFAKGDTKGKSQIMVQLGFEYNPQLGNVWVRLEGVAPQHTQH